MTFATIVRLMEEGTVEALELDIRTGYIVALKIQGKRYEIMGGPVAPRPLPQY